MSPFESLIVLPQLSDSSAASSSACLLDEVGQLEQEPAAVGGVHRAPGAGLQRPARGLDGPVDVGGGARGDLGDDLAGGRVVRLELSALDRIDPLVVDQQAGLADGRRGESCRNGLCHG